MEESLLMIIGISILIAAVIGVKSGIATALMEIMAGMIIGNVFPGELPDFILSLSGLGLITLMFIAGLEIDLSFLRKNGRQSIVVGLWGYVIPFFIVGLVAFYLFDLNSMQSLLFALGLSASSVGIIYTVLRQKGILGPRRKLILAAIMVTEFLSMALLGIFFSDLTWVIGIVIVFIFVVRYGFRFFQTRYHLFTAETTEKMAIKVVLAVLLIAEFLARGSGVDVILIVFALGILLAKYVEEHQFLKKEIEVISFGFLTPIFFFVTGFNISFVEIGAVFNQIIILVAVSFIATFVATYFAARKYFPRRAKIVALLFNSPMSIGIVAATIGLEKNVLDYQQYLMLLGAVLISSFIAIAIGRYPNDQSVAVTTPD